MLIGIAGRKQSGKDTVASMIQYILVSKEKSTYDGWKEFKVSTLNPEMYMKQNGTYIRIIPFAYHLKKCVADILNCPVKSLYLEAFKVQLIPWLSITVRQFLQRLGTEVGRNIDPDIWIKAFDHQFGGLINLDDLIIPDVRFVNEANYVKDHNGILLQTNRGSQTDFHQSEVDLNGYEKFDHILNNNGTLKELFENVKNIVINL